MLRRVGRKSKRGDTLVEVTLAIGILSMIAIAIAAVMTSGTSGAQTALETTLTREEIDTQAEALRYVQTAYAVNKNDTETNKYAALWKEIINHAIKIDGTYTKSRQEAILKYAPTSCDSLYDNNDIKKAAFVLNPRTLGTFTKDTVNTVYIPYADGTNPTGKLTTASIYPRLIYGTSDDQSGGLLESEEGNEESRNNLWRAEGIYVIAVRDDETTSVADDSSIAPTSAFYDFYIRSCWYGTNANEASSIATVIRLYDPDAVTAAKKQVKTYMQDWGGGRMQ